MSSTPKTNAPACDKQSVRESIPGNRDRAIVIGGRASNGDESGRAFGRSQQRSVLTCFLM
jgi:hypothetical protein